VRIRFALCCSRRQGDRLIPPYSQYLCNRFGLISRRSSSHKRTSQARCDAAGSRELGGRIAAVVRAIATAKAEGAILDRGVDAPIWVPQKTMNIQPRSAANPTPKQPDLAVVQSQAPTKQRETLPASDDAAVPSFDSLDDTASCASSSVTKLFEDGFLASSVKGKHQQQPLALLEEHAKKKRLGNVYVRGYTPETVCTDSCAYNSSIYLSKAHPTSLPPPKFYLIIGSKTYVPPNGYVPLTHVSISFYSVHSEAGAMMQMKNLRR
jgi:hypothetical protein